MLFRSAYLAGEDINWDWQNYHDYAGFALVHGRFDVDVAPGGFQSFLNPLIYLHDERQYTLAIGLQAFLGRHGSEWALLMAAATVITIPMIVLFFFAQKTFIEGIALTGVKG